MEKEYKNKKHKGPERHDEKLSRALSHILRHSAIQDGLQMNSAGYVELE